MPGATPDGPADTVAQTGRGPFSQGRLGGGDQGTTGPVALAGGLGQGPSHRLVQCWGEVRAMVGESWTWAHSTASSLSPRKGTTPVRHSNSTQPSAYWSARPSTVPPSICSGA